MVMIRKHFSQPEKDVVFYRRSIGCLLLLCLMLIMSPGCSDIRTVDENSGEKLATIHCGSCHAPVSPALLDSATWIDHVLPAMAPRLGISVLFENQYFQDDSTGAAISLSNWSKIIAWFKAQAPKQLSPAKPTEPLHHDTSLFLPVVPAVDSLVKATTTLVQFNPHDGRIYSGNAASQWIQWSPDLHPAIKRQLPSPAVQVNFEDGGSDNRLATLTCIGSILPNDIAAGMVVRIPLSHANHPANSKHSSADTLFSDLLRPVQSTSGDWNRDGRTDWLISAFGHNTGGLFLFEQNAEGSFTKKLLSATPGALRTETADYNNDGWPDIIALFAQADERIVLFTNDQHGGFINRELLKFSAVNGSTSFQMVDVNKDGNLDILYTAGDNADYSKILKPFHGVYVYLNKGDLQFSDADWFYPINGCFKAIAEDFDNDGDLDIATIAFFADLKNNPAEGFIYFEQDRSLHFIPHAVPVSGYGRWTCMEAADYNNDGRKDLLLGNYSNGAENPSGIKNKWYKHVPFLILKNMHK